VQAVACAVCNEVHAIFDADESKIIRDAKDGYPEGRTPRTLTLQERVNALCKYASDWKRWCLEKENTTPPAQEFTCSTSLCHYKAQRTWNGLTHDEYDAICDKHSAMSDFDFLADIEAKFKEKNQ
jgi:hypothetical protein